MACDELFLADSANGVLRAIRVRDNAGDERDMDTTCDASYHPESVCHMRDSDILLVCERHRWI